MSALERQLAGHFAARLRRECVLAELTSFRIGGPADLLLEVADEDELALAVSAARRCESPLFVLGAGTNLLISDRGIRGLVLRLGPGFGEIAVEGSRVRAGAAVPFGMLVATVVARGLAGLEFGEGIPGSVGGALIMNAGAFGGELARTVAAVEGVDREGRRCRLQPAEIAFGYRHSALPEGFIVARVDFQLEPGDAGALRARVAELKARRARHQPQGLPNAGSVFKNPPGGFAARLLDQCGLKGQRVGAAAFSEQHANFIVNLGGARAAHVRALIELARRRVEDQTGVRLEPELRMVGEWQEQTSVLGMGEA
ncbi:MAG TPA: UDP-N-acetylmuramate dehydrogenase [Candidatus Binataceae bacterium]|nr:UDP-N-acetylmuramate dehydrogenase [Candidatus Binataceae bacterium]